MLISHDLHFDVLSVTDIFLQKYGRITKGAFSFALSFIKERFEILSLFHNPHTAAATTEGCFDDERKSYFFRDLHRFLSIGDRIFGAG